MQSPIESMCYNEQTQDMEITMRDGEVIKSFFPTKRGLTKVDIDQAIKREIIEMKKRGHSYDSIHRYVKGMNYTNNKGKPISRHIIIQTVKAACG